MTGNLVALLSGVFFAALVIALRRQRGEGDDAAVTWGNALLFVLLVPLVAKRGELTLAPRSLLILAALGVFQIGLAYFFFVRGLRLVNATQASLTGMLEPVANPLWVFLFLHERPALPAIAGALIVLSAIAWRTLQGTPVSTAPLLD